MKSQKALTAAIAVTTVVALFLTLIAAGLLSASQTVPMTGTINAVNVGVYRDVDCTINCTSLDVGSLNPGDTANQMVYVKNTGNVPVTLSMAASNWNPANATSYLTLTWNRPGYVLGTGLSVQATLTLTVASSTDSLTAFSCSVTITGTQS
jgi:hypothetical protein